MNRLKISKVSICKKILGISQEKNLLSVLRILHLYRIRFQRKIIKICLDQKANLMRIDLFNARFSLNQNSIYKFAMETKIWMDQ
jgi:hypothetical protein